VTAYYNEIDPFAAQWLRELIKAGLIAPGEVDERSIEDIKPNDLLGFDQCHFFAGIGVWSLALRRAGWPDNRPVWTGSCPCQPFSASGKKSGFDDERHLWPAFHWLIQQCGPGIVIGEQVASKAAEPWLDLVQADMETMGYAFGALAFPSAGVGAPNIRDRAYWVGHSDESGSQGYTGNGGAEGWQGPERPATEAGVSGGVGNSNSKPAGRDAGATYAAQTEHGSEKSERYRSGDAGDTLLSGMANGDGSGRDQRREGVTSARSDGVERVSGTVLPGPVNGFWSDADWLYCRDGKWRPVKPGSFPLVDGAAARVGRLRGYGNAINAKAAEEFIKVIL